LSCHSEREFPIGRGLYLWVEEAEVWVLSALLVRLQRRQLALNKHLHYYGQRGKEQKRRWGHVLTDDTVCVCVCVCV